MFTLFFPTVVWISGTIIDWLTQSTKAGNPFAQYALGKLYLDGTLVQRDVALGMAYMERSARQGNAYAQLFIDRRDSLKPTSVMLAATRLLHQAASIFRENALPKTGAMQPAISRKRMQKLIEQKDYKAAVNYAREQEAEQQYSGMSMATPNKTKETKKPRVGLKGVQNERGKVQKL